MRRPGKLKWEGGRLILEIDATIRVPVELQAVERTAMSGIQLTRREGEVLDGILKGWSNKEIASQLNISVRTEKHYVSALFRTFQVSNRSELMALFAKNAPRSASPPV
jgi:DNA-binding NarL/FixJ family response regulator